jgi:hypothetical protein
MSYFKLKLLILFFTITSLSFSQEYGQYKLCHQKITVGGTVGFFNYSEDINEDLYEKLNGYSPVRTGTGKSDEYGFTPYFNLSYEALTPNVPLLIKIEGSLGAATRHTYDGSTYGDQTYYSPILDSIYGAPENVPDSEKLPVLVYSPYEFNPKSNSFYHLSAQMGYLFSINRVRLIPSLGFKMNLWSRALYLQDEYSQYKEREDYRWVQSYLSLKIEADLMKNSLFFWDVSTSYMMSGSMDFVEFGGATSNVTLFDSAVAVDKLGLDIEVGVVKRLSQFLAVTASPYFQFHQFGLSSIGTLSNGFSFVEPDSRTFNFGLNLALQFQFSPSKK